MRAIAHGPRSGREVMERNHHVHQEKTSIAGQSMMIHQDPVLMLTSGLTLSISACPALWAYFPSSMN